MNVIKKILVVLFFVVSVFEINAQQILKVKRSEFYITEAGFKEAWKSIKAGNKLLTEGPGYYREARKSYLKAYRYNPNNAELNYMIGICYLNTDDKFEALKYLKKAFKNNPEVSDDIRLMIARAYHHMYEFDNAILEYGEYLHTIPIKRLPNYKPYVDELITQCLNGKDLVDNPVRLVVLNPGKNVNSEDDEYNPVISRDDSIMFFTSRKMVGKKSPRNPYDSKFYEDVYFTSFNNGEWKNAHRLEKKINNKKNESNGAAVGINNEKDELYIYLGKSNNGDIFVSRKKNGKWTSLKPISSKINSKYRETSLCFTSDNKKMYFISNNPKSSQGGSDIFYSTKNQNGKWQKPVNLGPVINSKKDEIAVNLSCNDSVLFFSSKGHKSMGGYDVFYSKLTETGLWSAPVNMGYPVNTPDDDVFYVEIGDGRTAYYSTIREGSLGGKDIFKIIYLGAEKDVIQPDQNILYAGIEQFDNIFFTLPELVDVDTSITMYGKILDSENNNGIVSKIELIDNERNNVIATAISDADGNYKIKVPLPKMYGVAIVAKAYLLYLDVVDLTSATFKEDVNKDFKLDRVEVGAKVILKNIFFESGKATLKSESYVTLDNVVKLLQSNEGLRLEISGHTDNVGALKTNMKLSEDRAKSVVQYIVSKGISESRLESKGYAFNQPVAPNNTEAGRAQNRRVEFKVLSK